MISSDNFPSVKTFLIVLGVLILVNVIVMVAQIPFLPVVTGILFVGWLIWGLIGAFVPRRKYE